MVASVAPRNEGPGRNIEARAGTIISFFFGNGHVHSRSVQGMFELFEKIMSVFTVFEKEKEPRKFLCRIF